ncbi:hypothetical protein FOZ76_25230 [Verticiella sediminum]|uniref:MAPEG family protein n=1 Tax=Verticiella sediminum TaxID=1247510 RepID=A0A556A7T1_9BURK|nr:MAPEG family protein [Verticiella sediminum]TSH88937.1 hypothetical protein FOZ76_25230 [Verticiella sediminum]
MTLVTWMLIVAALLPFAAAGLAKAGGQGFDNNDPRAWLARQEGWRARANAAQNNLFEGLPFFFAAVLFALHTGADPSDVGRLMLLWVVLRVAYVWFYVAERGTLRSLVWALALAVNILIVFAG